MLTTEAMIADFPEEKGEGGGMPGGTRMTRIKPTAPVSTVGDCSLI